MKSNSSLISIVIVFLILCGCSSSASDPTAPDDNQDRYQLPLLLNSDTDLNHSLSGYGIINFDLENLEAEITYNRSGNHINVTSYLPPLGIKVNFFDPVTSVVDVDITITNPYPITGHDVRLIIYTDDFGHMLLNPDCWTDLYDIPTGLPINPFRMFGTDNPGHPFHPQSDDTKNCRIKIPGGNTDVSFAVDACYPGNCPEPYRILNFTQNTLYDEVNEGAEIGIDVYSWLHNVNAVSLYCPDITGVTLVSFTHGDYDTWNMDLINSTGAPAGDYTGVVLATTEDSGSLALYNMFTITVTEKTYDPGWARTWGSPGQDWAMDVILGIHDQILTVGRYEGTVDFDPGFDTFMLTSNGSTDAFLSVYTPDGDFVTALSWGGYGADRARRIIIDGRDDIYVCGFFRDRVDFDPGNDEWSLNAVGSNDAYISKFNSDLEFQWAISWGGPGLEDASCMALDPDLNIYVAGYFTDTVDFDPGSGIVNETSNGNWDCCLSKFNSSGDFLWVKTWGGISTDHCNYIISLADEKVLVTGQFYNTVDFDPTSTIDEYISNGESDAFLSMYAFDGKYLGTQTWGGLELDEGVCMFQDESGNILVAGDYMDTVDFDPGVNIDEYPAVDSTDSFISFFSHTLDYHHVVVMGGNGWENILDILVKDDDLYLVGAYSIDIDLDPGSGTDLHTSAGYGDAFLARYSFFGDYIWGNSWGSPGADYCNAIVLDSNDYSYVVSLYSETVDFHPGAGIDYHTARGEWDAYLMKTTSDGTW